MMKRFQELTCSQGALRGGAGLLTGCISGMSGFYVRRRPGADCIGADVSAGYSAGRQGSPALLSQERKMSLLEVWGFNSAGSWPFRPSAT